MRAGGSTTLSNKPFQDTYLVVDNFMPQADANAMRAAIEAHFANPAQHKPEAGCRQGQHNDAGNGRFGFVYSLTKNDRRSEGGETLIWRDDDDFATRLQQPKAGAGFYDAVAPQFNRLLVFDDRMPHAVQTVEGGMSPIEGRIVLHGHLREAGPIVTGALPEAEVAEIAGAMASDFAAALGPACELFHGLVVLRFVVAPNGSVTALRVVLNRIKRLAGAGPAVDDVIAALLERVRELDFPAADAATEVALPVGFGVDLVPDYAPVTQ